MATYLFLTLTFEFFQMKNVVWRIKLCKSSSGNHLLNINTVNMVNLQGFFQEFNASKFVVFSALLAFSLLYTLKLDGEIAVSYWTVFLPLWIWKGIASMSYIIFEAKLITTNSKLLMTQQHKYLDLFWTDVPLLEVQIHLQFCLHRIKDS